MEKMLDPTIEKAVLLLEEAGFYSAISAGKKDLLARALEDPFIDDSGRCGFVDAENIAEQGLHCLTDTIRPMCERLGLRVPQNIDVVEGMLLIFEDLSLPPLHHLLAINPFASGMSRQWEIALHTAVAAVNWYWMKQGYADRLLSRFNTGNDAFYTAMTPKMVSAYLASGFAQRCPLSRITLRQDGMLDMKTVV